MAGAYTVVSSPAVGGVNWSSPRALFLYQGADGDGAVKTPVADFTFTCADLTCSFTGAEDANAPISSYEWNFGDGTTGTGRTVSHTYGTGAARDVTLTVRTSQGASATKTKSVNTAAAAVQYVAAASTNSNYRASHTVKVPSEVQVGDTLLAYLTINSTNVTLGAPSGWTQLQTATESGLQSKVWTKTATAADLGSTVTVASSGAIKSSMTVSAHRPTPGSTLSVATSNAATSAASSTSLTTPAVNVAQSGSWLVSYWGVKSSNAVTLQHAGRPAGPVRLDQHGNRQHQRAADRLGSGGAVRLQWRRHRRHRRGDHACGDVLDRDRGTLMLNDGSTTPGEAVHRMAGGGPVPKGNGPAPERNGRVRHVEVGPFRVSDTPPAEIVDKVVSLSVEERTQPAFAFALHVGGLNARREREFVAAMRAADVVYADGGSVVWLAKLAGAHRVARAPTTDIGWDIMRGFRERTGRVPRVALIGGPEGLTVTRQCCPRVGRSRGRRTRRPRLPHRLDPAAGRSARGGPRTSPWSASVRRTRWSGASSTATSSPTGWCSPAAAGSPTSSATSAAPRGSCAAQAWSGSPGSRSRRSVSVPVMREGWVQQRR